MNIVDFNKKTGVQFKNKPAKYLDRNIEILLWFIAFDIFNWYGVIAFIVYFVILLQKSGKLSNILK